jgi:hypothetical protein
LAAINWLIMALVSMPVDNPGKFIVAILFHFPALKNVVLEDAFLLLAQ